MRSILFRPRARTDILDIWRWIAADNIAAADKVDAKIDGEIHKVAEAPNKGHHRADVPDPSYWFCSVYSYIIAYK